MKRFLETLLGWGLPAAAATAAALALLSMWLVEKPEHFFGLLLKLLGWAGIGAACLLALALIWAGACILRGLNRK